MSKFCQNCGAPLIENMPFCGSCGYPVPAVPVQQTPQPAAEPARQEYPYQAPAEPAEQEYTYQAPAAPAQQAYPYQTPAAPAQQAYPYQAPAAPAQQAYPYQAPAAPAQQAYPYQAPAQQAYPAPAPRKKSKAPLIILLVLLLAALVTGAALWFFVFRDKAPAKNDPADAVKADSYYISRIVLKWDEGEGEDEDADTETFNFPAEGGLGCGLYAIRYYGNVNLFYHLFRDAEYNDDGTLQRFLFDDKTYGVDYKNEYGQTGTVLLDDGEYVTLYYGEPSGSGKRLLQKITVGDDPESVSVRFGFSYSASNKLSAIIVTEVNEDNDTTELYFNDSGEFTGIKLTYTYDTFRETGTVQTKHGVLATGSFARKEIGPGEDAAADGTETMTYAIEYEDAEKMVVVRRDLLEDTEDRLTYYLDSHGNVSKAEIVEDGDKTSREYTLKYDEDGRLIEATSKELAEDAPVFIFTWTKAEG